RSQHPNIPLLLDDRHPTDAASYLAACVLYDVIYKKKSSDLPLTLPAPQLPQETRQLLRAIADQAVANPAQ
ncbi:MAG TPA: hypothetical protein VHM90_02305, partial [Phycisphaerae bacterium]|nr:hypothetical protein [Phycisphaerae bacterium]